MLKEELKILKLKLVQFDLDEDQNLSSGNLKYFEPPPPQVWKLLEKYCILLFSPLYCTGIYIPVIFWQKFEHSEEFWGSNGGKEEKKVGKREEGRDIGVKKRENFVNLLNIGTFDDQ